MMTKAESKEIRFYVKHRTAIFWFLLLLFYEVLLRLSTANVFWSVSLPVMALVCLPYALLINALLSLMSRRVARVVGGITLLALSIVYISQLVYHSIFFTFYSLFSAANGGQVLEFWEVALRAAGKNIVWIILYLIPLFLFLFKVYRLFPEKSAGLRANRTKLAVGVLSVCALFVVFTPLVRDPSSEYSLRLGQSDIKTSSNTIGMLPAMEIDWMSSVVPARAYSALKTPQPTWLEEPAPSPEATPSPSAASSDDSSPAPTPTPAWMGKVNELDIDFAALAQSAENKTVMQLHEYFGGVAATSQNDHTGIYEGYNLIMITAEAFSRYAVDETLTPTLYKMAHEGMYFTDFYNPIWSVSTSDGEYVACTGLFPKSGVWSFYKSAENDLPFVLGNQLNKLGYETRAYHDHSYKYYHRDVSHPNMGYDYKGVGNGLDIEKTWPESDVEMMEKTVPEYIGAEKFHTYYMTVSGHMNYSFSGNAMSYKHREAVAGLSYSEAARAYLACQIELDQALAYLLDQLRQAGVADKTLIVLSGDHYPYGLEVSQISELAGHDVEKTFELYKSTLICYVDGMTPETVTRPCSSIDILPTVSNLLGLEYDSRLLMGSDVFSNAPPLVMFQDRSFITDKGAYDAKKKSFSSFEGADIPEGYREYISKQIESKFMASKGILEQDYYRSLGID